jgi:hypothetical protein
MTTSEDGEVLVDAMAEYVANYEFYGDGGFYTPNKSERVLIEDALGGFIATQDDPLLAALRAIQACYPQNSNAHRIATEAIAKAQCAAHD